VRKSVLLTIFRTSTFPVIVTAPIFFTAEANAGHIQNISQDTAKSMCGKAWDGTGCLIVHDGHDHAITCYKDGCHNVVVTPTRTIDLGHGPGGVVSTGGVKQTTGSGINTVTSLGGMQTTGSGTNTVTSSSGMQHSGGSKR